MTDFAENQFVNLTNIENEELFCSICLEIFSNPVVVQCCRQIFCRQCITRWIKNNNSCPNDRKLLTENDLIEPPRILLNLINKQKIRSGFDVNQCREVDRLEVPKTQIEKCLSDPFKKTCSYCGLKLYGEINHNCIRSLKFVNSSLNDEVNELKDKINQLEQNIFQCLTNLDHSVNVILSARKYIQNGFEPIIKDCKAAKDVKNNAIRISKEAIEFYDTFLDISHHIYNEIGRKDMLSWHVITHANNCGETRVFFRNNYIDLLFDQLRIQIFDT